MKSIFSSVLILLSFAWISQLANATEAENNLIAWAHKYPSGNAKHSFFDEAALRAPLSHLSRIDQQRLRKIYAVETPIEFEDGYLIAHVCKPHLCPGENAVVIIRPHDQSMVVFFYDGEKDETRCFSTEMGPVALPSSVKELVLESHIPRMSDSDILIDNNPWFNKLVCKPLSGS